MLSPLALLALEALTTSALCGLIWTIQLVHYPLMARVGQEGFAAYEEAHTRKITPLVAPLMGLELILSLAAPFLRAGTASTLSLYAGLFLTASLWIVTAAISVPCHARLGRGFDPAVHRRLVQTNWLRTLGWTARLVLLGAALFGALSGN